MQKWKEFVKNYKAEKTKINQFFLKHVWICLKYNKTYETHAVIHHISMEPHWCRRCGSVVTNEIVANVASNQPINAQHYQFIHPMYEMMSKTAHCSSIHLLEDSMLINIKLQYHQHRHSLSVCVLHVVVFQVL